MHITYRPATAEDVDGCFSLLPAGFACGPALRACLPDLWRGWLRDGVMRMTAVEDGGRPPGERLIAFGNSIFVTDEFLAEAEAGRLAPPLAARVAERALAGASPLLDWQDTRRANSGDGLNVLVLHIGWAEHLDAEQVRWVKAKLLEAFVSTHAGYRINALSQEVYSEEEVRRGLAVGVGLRTDYAGLYDRDGTPPPLRPFLIGAARAEVQDGSMISPLFFYAPPRFFFKPWEQDLLGRALLGRSDAEIAADLHVSASTVQKRWRAVHERAASVAPDLFPPDAAAGESPQTRGAEKRRPLLAYLRHHPEELRPAVAPKKGNGTSG